MVHSERDKRQSPEIKNEAFELDGSMQNPSLPAELLDCRTILVLAELLCILQRLVHKTENKKELDVSTQRILPVFQILQKRDKFLRFFNFFPNHLLLSVLQ